MPDDRLVTATEASDLIPSVSRHLVLLWRKLGKLKPVGRRGRSPLYRWGDITDVEMTTRRSGRSHRGQRIAAA